MSSEKVWFINFNCLVIVDVRYDGFEFCVDVLFGDGYCLIMCGVYFIVVEMFIVFVFYIWVRDVVGSVDKLGVDISC